MRTSLTNAPNHNSWTSYCNRVIFKPLMNSKTEKNPIKGQCGQSVIKSSFRQTLGEKNSRPANFRDTKRGKGCETPGNRKFNYKPVRMNIHCNTLRHAALCTFSWIAGMIYFNEDLVKNVSRFFFVQWSLGTIKVDSNAVLHFYYNQ